MSKKNWDAKASNYDDSSWESESDEAIDDRVYAEEGEYGNLGRKFGPEFPGECQVKKWGDLGEFGEAKRYYIFEGEGTEYGDTFGEYESGAPSMPTVAATEIEETEEEKALRKEREQLIDDVKVKIMERMLLRRRNAFLQKKLVEHFRKRRMEDVFKQETKGLDIENKYLKRLYVFKEFKQAQEKEIEELTQTMKQCESDTKVLAEELEENLKNLVARAKEVSLTLILSKSGKRINEKTIDRLLRRMVQKNEEQGRKKLRYIKIKKLIEEKELQLKTMQYFGDGLHIADYEQMKIDNQNYTDKIEEKEDELAKLRIKTQGIMQNLANVREKAYAIEGDIEIMEEKVYAVENTVAEIRERLTNARKRRDYLREEFSRLKTMSGLLTKSELLRDFERSITEANSLQQSLHSIKKVMNDKSKQNTELNKIANANNRASVSLSFKRLSRFSTARKSENR